MNKNKTSTVILLALFLVFSAAVVLAQAGPSPKMVAANELFKARQWAEAAKAYEAILKDEPKNARAYYQLGMARFSLAQFELAIDALQKNIAISNNATAMYNVACANARLGRKDKALEWLEKAINNQLQPFSNPADDPDFVEVRNEPRFKELMATLDRQRRPCMYSAEARQFDFWVGEWDVFNVQGQKTGTSVIQQISAGCGVLENWRDVFGNEGKSINFYDSNTHKWHQYWIGASGGPGRFSGIYENGALRYEGEPAVVNGARTLSRLTFFNVDANTVRQFAEQSADEGKVWTTTYDFKYVRTK